VEGWDGLLLRRVVVGGVEGCGALLPRPTTFKTRPSGSTFKMIQAWWTRWCASSCTHIACVERHIACVERVPLPARILHVLRDCRRDAREHGHERDSELREREGTTDRERTKRRECKHERENA